MKSRCQFPGATAFHKYGAKGIRVCERWQSFENFLTDMGECPTAKHGVDRKDPKGHYEPSNCRWATQKEQQNNRGNNRRITFGGRTMTLAQWGDETGLSHGVIGNRIDNLGWSVHRALTEPSKPGRRPTLSD